MRRLRTVRMARMVLILALRGDAESVYKGEGVDADA
jgi:hypothetical protein